MEIWYACKKEYFPNGVPFVQPTGVRYYGEYGYELQWTTENKCYIRFAIKPGFYVVKYSTSPMQRQPWFEGCNDLQKAISMLQERLDKYYVGG